MYYVVVASLSFCTFWKFLSQSLQLSVLKNVILPWVAKIQTKPPWTHGPTTHCLTPVWAELCKLWASIFFPPSLPRLDWTASHRVVLKIQPSAWGQTQTVTALRFNLSSLSPFLLRCGGAELIENKCPVWNWSCKGPSEGGCLLGPFSVHSQVPLAHITLRYSCHQALASGAERARDSEQRQRGRLGGTRETKTQRRSKWEENAESARRHVAILAI